MPPKPAILVDDLVKALQDPAVLAAIGLIFDNKLKELQSQNTKLREELTVTAQKLELATLKLDEVESYTNKSNLLVTGLPYVSAAEATSTESSIATETALLRLVNDQLGLSISPGDISTAHRLPKTRTDDQPATVIVRFTNLKAREQVYRARFGLKNIPGQRIYVNEHLTRKNASVFRAARELVKKKVLHSATTKNGFVFVKKTADSVLVKVATEMVLQSTAH
jgi:hypothetical protein